MIRSFGTLRGVNPGFDARNVLTGAGDACPTPLPDDAKRIAFFANLDRAARARFPAWRAPARSATCRSPGLGAAHRLRDRRPAASRCPDRTSATDVSVCDDGYFRDDADAAAARPAVHEREMREKSNVVVVNDDARAALLSRTRIRSARAW
mgnify:CR=1 FL=1